MSPEQFEAAHDRVWELYRLVKAKKMEIGHISHRKSGTVIKVADTGKPSDWKPAKQVDGKWVVAEGGAKRTRKKKGDTESPSAPAPVAATPPRAPEPAPEPPKPTEPPKMKARHIRLGVQYGGNCAVCGRHTGNRPFEKDATALYKTEDGKFVPVHPSCAGGQTKHAVRGGIKYRTEPDDVIHLDRD